MLRQSQASVREDAKSSRLVRASEKRNGDDSVPNHQEVRPPNFLALRWILASNASGEYAFAFLLTSLSSETVGPCPHRVGDGGES